MAIATQVTNKDISRLDELIEAETRAFLARQRRSRALTEEARTSLAGGVTSSWQISNPQPIWIDHAAGSKIWDADGLEYSDFHGGYGANAVGHANPKVVDAVSKQVRGGTHFGQPVEHAMVVSRELARRFGLPKWRFGNSGTEATMDAFHLMRAYTGKWKVIKVEGSYHGHHDSAQVSVYSEPPDIGPADHPNSVASEGGIPDEIVQLTRVVPFNDLEVLRRVVEENEGQLAGMIIEPIMMNIGIILPEDGYIQGVRDITREHGMLLAFDEVKTGLTVAAGGATEYLGVTPDLVCLAKSMGGGLSTSAIGGTEEVMATIENGGYEQCGTFNGNPLAMAAARAAVTEVLTPDAYEHAGRLREIMVSGVERVIGEYDLPAYVTALGFKGCVVFSPTKLRNYRDYLEWDDRFSQCHWLFQHKGGVLLPPWGKVEQWMLSVQHQEEDARKFVDNFETFAKALRT
ncbi:MAG: aspartate aminotransferase family protein [Actinomycetota bacterium]